MGICMYVFKISLLGCLEGVGFELAAAAREHKTVGQTRARLASGGAAGRDIVELRFQQVEAARANVGSADQNVRRQLALKSEVPPINRRNVVRAARIVGHGDLVERRIVRKVRWRREWIGEGRIGSSRAAVTIQCRLRGSLGAKGVAEGTGCGRGSWTAIASRREYELRAKRPFIHIAVAEHAH